MVKKIIRGRQTNWECEKCGNRYEYKTDAERHEQRCLFPKRLI